MRNKNLISIGSDHAGFGLKQRIISYLNDSNYIVKDFGCYSEDSVDYPEIAYNVGSSICDLSGDFGILICGSGSGMSIVANKVKNVRAVNCFSLEMAELAVQHNDANILCLGARYIPNETAIEIVETFLKSKFQFGRHQIRVDKIHKITGV